MTRRFLSLVCRGMVGVLLFAQMAIAAYACPFLASEGTLNMQGMSMGSADGETAAMATAEPSVGHTPCEVMAGALDAELPNLCAGHCHYGEQSDQASTLTVPLVLLSALYATPPSAEAAVPPRPSPAAVSALVAACPPHAILHCRFQI